MAKNSVSDWDTTAGNNTDVGGINIDEGMSGGDVNNAIREIMAQIKAFSTTVVPAGTVQAYIGTTAPSGWLFLNGDTLGSAGSTATQSSDDYQTLYELLWNSFAQTEAEVLDGGRGASANADWTANKRITLPDATGRAIFGKEASATRLTSAVSLDGGVLGKAGGDQNMPSHTHPLPGNTGRALPSGGSDTSVEIGGGVVGNTNSAGTGTAGNVPPAIILNWIIKT